MKICNTSIRVRYQETDNMGVVYYSNYFVWFEVARTEHLKIRGISYRELEKKGMYMMVASASCQYKHPARYDDEIRIESSIPEIKNSSLKFAYKVHLGDKVIATGETLHVMTNKEGRPIRIPQELKDSLA
jgi:acyl-CoA thioester hydrolase